MANKKQINEPGMIKILILLHDNENFNHQWFHLAKIK
jgi:hypothetical protein